MRLIFLLISLIIVFPITGQLYSQTKYQFLTGANKKGLDTLAVENAMKISQEVEGLMESEIEPNKYIVGPNDHFIISVILIEPIEIRTKISPDGSLYIKGVGIVNLKGKTLTEAYQLIKEKSKKRFNALEVNVTISKIRKFKVIVSGHVPKPISVTASAMDRVSEVIQRAGGMKLDAGLRAIKLIRNNELIKVDLAKFYLLGDKESNPYVLGGDFIIVNPIDFNNLIEISGDIASEEAIFEFVEGDSLSTLIKLGQGFLKSAHFDSVEIARYNIESNFLKRWFVDLTTWKENLFQNKTLLNDFPLQSGDRVYIRKKIEWVESDYIVIEGEVKYPGKYAINEGVERVSDLIKRAGGITDDAAIYQVEFIRQKEKDIRDRELERLWETNVSEMTESEKRYFRVRSREKRGVMALDVESILNDYESVDNILLVSKDSLIIPRITDYINVQGSVGNPGLIKYKPDLTYMEYIKLAGGFSSRADEDETFISKVTGEQFIAEDLEYILEPGDVILVPQIKEVSFLEQWQAFILPISQTLAVVGVLYTILRP